MVLPIRRTAPLTPSQVAARSRLSSQPISRQQNSLSSKIQPSSSKTGGGGSKSKQRTTQNTFLTPAPRRSVGPGPSIYAAERNPPPWPTRRPSVNKTTVGKNYTSRSPSPALNRAGPSKLNIAVNDMKKRRMQYTFTEPHPSPLLITPVAPALAARRQATLPPPNIVKKLADVKPPSAVPNNINVGRGVGAAASTGFGIRDTRPKIRKASATNTPTKNNGLISGATLNTLSLLTGGPYNDPLGAQGVFRKQEPQPKQQIPPPPQQIPTPQQQIPQPPAAASKKQVQVVKNANLERMMRAVDESTTALSPSFKVPKARGLPKAEAKPKGSDNDKAKKGEELVIQLEDINILQSEFSQDTVDNMFEEEIADIKEGLGDFAEMKVEQIKSQVCSHLTTKDLLSLRSTSSSFSKIVTPLLLFTVPLSDSTMQNVMSLFARHRNSVEVCNLVISNLHQSLVPSKIMPSKTIKSVKLAKPSVINKSEAGGCYISQKNLESLLKGCCRSLEWLEIDSGALGKVVTNATSNRKVAIRPFLRDIPLNKMTLLVMDCSLSDTPYGYTLCTDLLQNNFPSLLSVSIWFHYDLPTYPDFPPFYTEFVNFLLRHAQTLKSVRFSHSGSIVKSHLYKLSVMDDEIEDLEYQNLRDKMASLNGLEDLQLSPSLFEGQGHFQLVSELIAVQQSLHTFTILHIHRSNFGVMPQIYALISQCSPTLKSLTIAGCICDPLEADPSFSLGILNNCGRLEQLDFSLCGMRVEEFDSLPKSLKSLHLADLTKEQIETVMNVAGPALEKWILLQKNAGYFPNVVRLSVEILQEMTRRLPNLGRVVTLKETVNNWEEIQNVVDESGGRFHLRSNTEPTIKKGHVAIDIMY